MELIQLLLDPKLVGIWGPLGVIAVIEGYAVYRLFKMVNDLQEKRLAETVSMKAEYVQLVKDVDKTMELILKLNRKGNGNA